MATWIIWGRVELGRVEARDKEHAIVAATRQFPEAVGVQSLASHQVACEEARIAWKRGHAIREHNGNGRMGRA